MNASALVQKVWNFCHTLRDDGVGYGDYLEQLTYLLFLKMSHLRHEAFFGNEIVAGTRRLCLMNLFLHNIGDLDGEPSVDRSDALISDRGKRFDYVLANPPFGKKSSMTITNEDGDEDRDALTEDLNDLDDLPPPDVLQQEIIEHLEAALMAFRDVAASLPKSAR